MALGSDNNYQSNSGKTKYREPEVYSCYNMSNVEGVDPSALSFSFFRNLLKVSIAPKIANPTGDKMWDHDNATIIYLTHTKARMLREEIDKVLSGEKFNGGVNSGTDGLISFSDGKEIGSNYYCLIIRKIDENGNISSTYAYEFKSEYHYGISNFDSSNSTHDKDYFDNLEIEQFKCLLEDYYRSMTNALAYTVVNNLRFDMSRINTKLTDIAEANGITYNNRAGNGNNRSSFFNNSDNASQVNRTAGNHSGSRASTMEELEDKLG